MSHMDHPSGSEIANLLACHALTSALARGGLPTRRDARRALVRLFSQTGVPTEPIIPRSPEEFEEGFITDDSTFGDCLAGLVLAAFRPDNVTEVRQAFKALSHYHQHPDEWQKDILVPFDEWLSE